MSVGLPGVDHVVSSSECLVSSVSENSLSYNVQTCVCVCVCVVCTCIYTILK